ncbi:DUF4173 domain-containing protein [Planosporangium flavigriseum]|uniref:DUF4173 domain-containing protein n=1 Tax=Planosporangium flavigriseum TaxID=373681 RepID=A0A8J3LHS8_9ACTN|nr:DUF4173 domain-containing protein [Planosporangium flavigriseum]NJC64570.1 DUF4173 domain-containing protein [Planosporangium flavigriseum]GIG71947.1 hypothetical protein Pfl04_03510 [Planosporangium flavigriseum]
MEDSSKPPLPGRTVLGAVLVAAVLGAGTVTLDRPGLGWLLTGVALLAVAGVQFHVWPGMTRCLWAAAGIALLGVGTVRAAGWLYAFCVPLAGVCALQALVGGASVRAMLAGALTWPEAVVQALPWTGRAVRALAPRSRPQAVARLLVSALVSVLLLVVFGALFASADQAFARLLARAVPDVEASGAPRWLFLFVTVGLAALGIAYLVAAPPSVIEPGEPGRPLRLAEWALPVALLDAQFGAFVLVQLTVLFGGRDHVLRPGGPDFAQYARGGFWQLLAVTSLTLAVIGVVARFAPRAGQANRAAIRVLVGVLSALTLVIVASALKRMALYEEAYGYTRLRLAVSAAELWLGLLFVLVLIAGVRRRTAWLPRAVLASAVVGLLGFAALDPDRFIAGQNVDRFERTGRVDVQYLSELSADAAPELARLPVAERAALVVRWSLRDERDPWYSYNYARSRAKLSP